MTDQALTPGRVLVIGSANQDVVLAVAHIPEVGETVLATDRSRGFGGKGANQAVAAARAGASVEFIGMVGNDGSGVGILDNFRSHGVGTTWTQSTERAETGLAIVVVDASGRNQIVVSSGAGEYMDPAVVDDAIDTVSAQDVVVVQCEISQSVVASVLTATSRSSARSILNLAPYVQLPSDVVSLADFVVVNETEATSLLAALGRDSLRDSPWVAIAEATGSGCIVTLGERGSAYANSYGSTAQVAAEALSDVVDTTGAGDVYVGTLAAALAAGAEVPEAMRSATHAASASVLSRGAQSRHTPSTVKN